MITIRCKVCNTELTGTTKIQCCGCPNMMKIIDRDFSAMDLDKVIIVSDTTKKDNTKFGSADIEWQRSRSKRKIRKMDFEVR